MSREDAINIIRNSTILTGRCNGKSIFMDAINTLLDTERKTGEWTPVEMRPMDYENKGDDD